MKLKNKNKERSKNRSVNPWVAGSSPARGANFSFVSQYLLRPLKKVITAILRPFVSFYAILRHNHDTLMDVLGWVFAINGAGLVSILGWIPFFTGISPGYYMLAVFIISLPLAVWLSRDH